MQSLHKRAHLHEDHWSMESVYISILTENGYVQAYMCFDGNVAACLDYILRLTHELKHKESDNLV